MKLYKELIDLEKEELNTIKSAIDRTNDLGVKTIFETIERNCKSHIDLLKDLEEKKEELDIEKENFDVNIFTCLDDCDCARLHSEEISLYTNLADYEKKLVRKYESIIKETKEDKAHEILKYIKKKHNDAQFVLEDMVSHLNKPNEWVESAEFTLREPY